MLEYTVILQVMGQEMILNTTRTIETATLDGQQVLRVTDVATLPTATIVDKLDLDRATLMPVRRSMSGGATIELSYTEEAITGEMGMQGQMTPVNVELAAPVFSDGSGLEMVMAGLPLEEGYATTLRIFEPQMQKVRPMLLSVTGTETTQCAAGTFETFVVEITPLDDDEAGTSTVRVLQEAPHHVVLREFKLPAAMGGGMGNKELTSAGGGGTR